MKILHVLDHYKPHFSGYVFRTSYILKHQRELGLEPVLVTSPKQGAVEAEQEEIDGMRVYRTGQTEFGGTPFLREKRLMEALEARIEAAAREELPDVIHAHSPSLNGIPALRVGKRLGIPVVYEVRAFWEDAAVDHGTFAEGSLKYRVSRYLETRLFRGVDALFTICEGLRSDIAARGIPADKTTVIPNCVDLSTFTPLAYDHELASRLGIGDEPLFGFIGSFYNYEGLSLLLEAFKGVRERGCRGKLLLVGDGPDAAAVRRKAVELGLVGPVIMPGKVPHQEVNRYYSIIDCLVYPRLSMRLTELVTPLKPLEAMAMGKVVVGSDVGGIRELVTDGRDGFLFPAGDVGALTSLLADLAGQRRDLAAVRREGLETVLVKHDWKRAVERYLPVYEAVTR